MDTTLVIMAAGIGSRFGGGIKQLAPVGPNGEIIMDYSIYDALEAGFNKIVFIIRRDLEKDFKEIIGNRIEKICKVEYAFQENDNLPGGFVTPADRKKPWGTGHAILSTKGIVNEPFLVINADDYYGRSAFETLGAHLSAMPADGTEHAMVGFILGNTMSRSGTVSRAVCTVKDNYLVSMKENTKIGYEGDKIISLLDGQKIELTGKEWVSMNFFGFSPKAFEEFHLYWEDFIANNLTSEKAEALLPEAASNIVSHNQGKIKVYTSPESWFGMTYPEDRATVKVEIAKKIQEGYYPEILWEK